MIDYCALTNFPNATPFELDGTELIHTSYNALGKYHFLDLTLWSDSLALKRSQLDEAAQAKLDAEWRVIDAAYLGDSYAKQVLAIRKGLGYVVPKSRDIKSSQLGLPAAFSSDYEGRLTVYGKEADCLVCGTLMLVKNKREHRTCSPKCKTAMGKAKYDRANAKRQKVVKQEVNCSCCDKLFTQSRADAKLCSNACRVRKSRESRKA